MSHDVYQTIRLVKQRLQDLERKAANLAESHERQILVETLDALVVLARECETVAHHSKTVQERLSEFAATIALMADEIFGPAKGEA